MLISRDLLQHLATFVAPPAQLCLIRILGSDHEYVFRVRYKYIHLDYPFAVPLFDNASIVESKCNFDELAKALHVASKMVVPPGETVDSNWNQHPQPCVLVPIVGGAMRYEY